MWEKGYFLFDGFDVRKVVGQFKKERRRKVGWSGGRSGDGVSHSLEVATTTRRAITARRVARVDESVHRSRFGKRPGRQWTHLALEMSSTWLHRATNRSKNS